MPTVPVFPLRLFYDGGCSVCAGEIDRYLRRDRAGRLVPVDISAAGFDPHPHGISLEAFQYELHAIDRVGTVFRGVDAFRAIWLAFPEEPLLRVLATLVVLPVISPLARAGYRGFARIRRYLPKRRSACHSGICRVGRK